MMNNNPEQASEHRVESVPHIYERVSLGAIERIARPTATNWGPPPLDPYDDTVIEGQLEVKRIISERVLSAVPESVPLEIVDFVKNTFDKRFRSRESANHEHFSGALQALRSGELVLPEQYDEMLQRARVGVANPAELLMLRSLLAVRGVALVTASHGYASGIENIYPARESVADAMKLFGARYDNTWERFAIKEAETDDSGNDYRLRGALLMTRKRQLGSLIDGTVLRERSSFILRIDPTSGFDQGLADAMHHAYDTTPDISWKQNVMDAGRLNEVVPRLLNEDKFKTAIPLSTTIYAFHPDVIPREFKHADWRTQMPNMFEAFDEAARSGLHDAHRKKDTSR